MSKSMLLQCEAGHKWERTAQRGRPPRFCPQHTPGARAPAKITPLTAVEDAFTPLPSPVDDGLRAALVRPTEPGKVVIGSGKDSAKPRMRVHVSEIQVGDWTHVTGFRPVTAVKIFPRKREVKLRWSDGSSETFSFTYPDTDTKEPIQRMLLVHRPEQ